ncbi:MAG: hypothetical protein ABSG79_12420 [Bryobacteraceae bacterium]|jgi:hypothetical protein
MRYRLLAAVFAVSLAATAQTLSVRELVSFLQSSEQLIKEGKQTDGEVAKYLAKVRLTERLDDRIIEDMQGLGIGAKTLQALQALRDRTKDLMEAKPIAPQAPPAPIPPPSSEEQAAIIADVREYALNYSKNLPDFICTQVTRRYAAPMPGTRWGGSSMSEPRWQAEDVLQIRLSYSLQTGEKYLVVLANNTIVNKDYSQMGGSKSFGEFGSMLREIFEPSTEARFEWDHWGTLRGKRVMAFAYHVSQSRSQYRLVVEDAKLSIITAYHGLVEVDPDTHVVMRVTTIAENIPPDFPIRKAEDVLDYDYTDLSGHTFLLPLKSQVLMSGGDVLTRLDEEFRLYRKYSADAEIKYDADPLPPLPDDKTKETPTPNKK